MNRNAVSDEVKKVLNFHLTKFQSFLEKLAENPDDKDIVIKDEVFKALAKTAYNDDFDAILSQVATVFITVAGNATWASTIPLTKLFDKIFNAHTELDFQEHQLEKIETRRQIFITNLVSSRIEIPLSQLFKKLRQYEMKQPESEDEGTRLQQFFKFRRKWRKKPGGEPLKKALAKMDAMIRKFDDEWPQIDEDLLQG